MSDDLSPRNPAPRNAVPRNAVPRYRVTPKYVLMLGVMSALGPLSTDMYLPNLPNVAVDLHTSELAAQLTILAMLIGAATGQLVVGPLSDHFGRRRPALLGVALHVIISGLCMITPSIIGLIGLRVAMGFCNAAAGVVGMAVIRDRFVGRDAARLMSRLMLVIGAAPLLAPVVGAAIGTWIGWRGVFAALGLYGLALFAAIWTKLPETLPASRRIARLGSTWRGYAALLRDRHFVALAAIPGFIQAVLMSYIVGSPFVLQDGYGLSPLRFSLVFGANGVALIAGSQVNAALVRRIPIARILRVALPGSVAATTCLAIVGATGAGGLPALLACLFAVMCLHHLTPSNASALALSRHGERAGTASACIGFLQNLMPALIAPCVGLLGGSAGAMGGVMAACAAGALVVLALGTPVYRRGGADEIDRAATSVPQQ